MSESIPILEGESLSAEDKRLIALFDKMEGEQVEFLDQSGKRIIELCTVMLGLLFAVIAFGDRFPPPYLAQDPRIKWLLLAVLALYLLALIAGVFAVRPRRYARYHHNLSAMRRELEQIVTDKTFWFQIAVGLLVIGSLALACLIGWLVLTA
jgi:hypothetical protein